MNIVPKYDSNTIKIATNAPTKLSLSTPKVVTDPTGQISNGIYRVIHWEMLRQFITIIVSGTLLLGAIILIILFSTAFKTSWPGYIIPVMMILLAGYKFFISLIEKSALKKAVTRYKEDLRIGLTSTPPFIVKLYQNIYKKQVGHNWLTFFLLLNGGILTILLWWLKDVSWWIFDFEGWIHAMFNNPTLMSWIFTVSLLAIAVVHIVMAIQRKKRILEIDAYFGSQIVPTADINEIKSSRNKAYRRLFIIYVMVILIIPLIVKMCMKLFRRSK